MAWGGSGAQGKGDFCLSYIPILSLTGVSVQLCGRAHLHRGERSESNSGRIVGCREGAKKLMPARHPVSGRLLWFSQRDFIVLNTASSGAFLFLCMYTFDLMLCCDLKDKDWIYCFSALASG